MPSPSADDLAGRLAQLDTVMLTGAMDTGKSTLGRAIARTALDAGRTVAYIDADIGNSTIGPPTCVGSKLLRTRDDLESIRDADRLAFVGGFSPDRLVLQQVIGTAALAAEGERTADLVVVDTTAAISGVVGETLKYHKAELIRPNAVVALQRGGEMEPLVGLLQRFFSIDVIVASADPDVPPSAPDERASRRADLLRRAFTPPMERWRVRPTVFAPTLPTGLDLGRLDGVIVGIQDGTGACLGLGRLEHDGDTLRVLTSAGEGMQGLRLGSLRLDLESYEAKPVNLRELIFGV